MSIFTISKVALLGAAASLVACTSSEIGERTPQAAELISKSKSNLLEETSALRVATWNVEHLAYPFDTGCKPRSANEIKAMGGYVKRIDADIFALQEVASEQAVRLLFPETQWQIFMSPRADSASYECRGSGNTSTQQKMAYAVRKGLVVKDIQGLATFGLDRRGLRYALQMNVETDFGDMSLLNVHMKSGCFVDNYSRAESAACEVFSKQAPILDQWVEDRERENRAYVVLGDFNHRLSAPYNHLTQKLFTNSDGSSSSLQNTTADLIGCHPYYPAPIDSVFVGELQNNSLTLASQFHHFDNMQVEAMLSDHCALSLSITATTKPLSNALKWQTISKEYGFLTRAIYQQASNTLNQTSLPKEKWVVVMDVDETILDNSPYQLMLHESGLSYTPATWSNWVMRAVAKLVPGAQSFMQTVLDLGGTLALITNREKSLDAYTWQNLTQNGLPISIENTCLLGRSQLDKGAIDGINIINDKDLRRQQVQGGNADCYHSNAKKQDLSSWLENYQIVMQVGDNIEDFSGVTQEDADAAKLIQKWPNKLILLPNTLYGSW